MSADFAELIRRHRPDLAGEIRCELIRTGKFNDSYFVDAVSEELVLRIAPPRGAVFVFYEREMMRQEPELHELLLARTSVPVPRILAFDDTHELIDRDFLIMERLPGQPLTSARGVSEDKVFRQVGAMLAEAHAVTAERYGYLGAHRPMAPQATWAEAFTDMWRRLLADVAAVGHYSDADRRVLEELLAQHIGLFEHSVAASLLHMDVWHQNILVGDDGAVTGLVDWDRALWGDPEIEFAVLDYCGVSTPAFWEGYGKARDESPEARVRNVFYLLYEIQKYIVIRHGRGNDPRAARGYKQQVMDIVGRCFG